MKGDTEKAILDYKYEQRMNEKGYWELSSKIVEQGNMLWLLIIGIHICSLFLIFGRAA